MIPRALWDYHPGRDCSCDDRNASRQAVQLVAKEKFYFAERQADLNISTKHSKASESTPLHGCQAFEFSFNLSPILCQCKAKNAKKKKKINKSLLVATTVEEVASVVSIPFLIICVQIIYRQTQKQKNNNQNYTKRKKGRNRCIHFHHVAHQTSQTVSETFW